MRLGSLFVSLVFLVHVVSLVCSVHLVLCVFDFPIRQPNERDKPKKPVLGPVNKTDQIDQIHEIDQFQLSLMVAACELKDADPTTKSLALNAC
jgi:hypothetical protein